MAIPNDKGRDTLLKTIHAALHTRPG